MVAQVLLATVPPAVITVIVLALAWRPWRTDAAIAGGRWGGAAGFGLAFLTGFLAVAGWPGLPPTEKWQWILHLGLLAAAIGVVNALRPRKRWLDWLPSLCLAATAALLLRHPSPDAPWTWNLGVAAAVAFLWLTLEPVAQRARGVTVPLTLLLTFAAAAIVILVSGNETLARLTAVLAASAAGAAIVAWWAPAISLAAGATAVTVAVLPGLLFLSQAYSYSEVPGISFLLPLLAPAMSGLGELPVMGRLKPPARVLIRMAAILLPLGIAVGLAITASEPGLYLG
ncbi:MAG: hypothetical protein ACYSXF_11365 [Planctomycetota bacterium]|jgi:hypothetical protein